MAYHQPAIFLHRSRENPIQFRGLPAEAGTKLSISALEPLTPHPTVWWKIVFEQVHHRIINNLHEMTQLCTDVDWQQCVCMSACLRMWYIYSLNGSLYLHQCIFQIVFMLAKWHQENEVKSSVVNNIQYVSKLFLDNIARRVPFNDSKLTINQLVTFVTMIWEFSLVGYFYYLWINSPLPLVIPPHVLYPHGLNEENSLWIFITLLAFTCIVSQMLSLLRKPVCV